MIIYIRRIYKIISLISSSVLRKPLYSLFDADHSRIQLHKMDRVHIRCGCAHTRVFARLSISWLVNDVNKRRGIIRAIWYAIMQIMLMIIIFTDRGGLCYFDKTGRYFHAYVYARAKCTRAGVPLIYHSVIVTLHFPYRIFDFANVFIAMMIIARCTIRSTRRDAKD